MRGWYRDALDCPPPPARVSIATMTVERVEMFWHIPMLGHPITVGVQLFPVEKSIPEEEDIAWLVRRLLLNCSGSLPGMRVEHIYQ